VASGCGFPMARAFDFELRASSLLSLSVASSSASASTTSISSDHIGFHMLLRALACSLISMCGYAVAAGPDTEISIPPMHVVPPAGEGWRVVRQDDNNVVFQRINVDGSIQSTAYASLANLNAPDDMAAVEAALKGVVTSSLPRELSVQEVQYERGRLQGMPCATAVIRARQSIVVPQGEAKVSAAVTMSIRACRPAGEHPIWLLAAYSDTTREENDKSALAATRFLAGVTWGNK